LVENKCKGLKYKACIGGPENNRYFHLIDLQCESVILARSFSGHLVMAL